jgi:hypothetical protein
MTLIRDDKAFEPLQRAFVERLVEAVYADTKAAGIEGDLLRDVVNAACFSAANMLDGDPGFEVGTDWVYPTLVFLRHPDRNTAVAPKENGWMHEYVASCVRETIERDSR